MHKCFGSKVIEIEIAHVGPLMASASGETGPEETFSHSLMDAFHVIYVPHPKSLSFLQAKDLCWKVF